MVGGLDRLSSGRIDDRPSTSRPTTRESSPNSPPLYYVPRSMPGCRSGCKRSDYKRHDTTISGCSQIVELLLDAKADLNAKARLGAREDTPLSVAELKGHTEVVELLRKRGATE